MDSNCCFINYRGISFRFIKKALLSKSSFFLVLCLWHFCLAAIRANPLMSSFDEVAVAPIPHDAYSRNPWPLGKSQGRKVVHLGIIISPDVVVKKSLEQITDEIQKQLALAREIYHNDKLEIELSVALLKKWDDAFPWLPFPAYNKLNDMWNYVIDHSARIKKRLMEPHGLDVIFVLRSNKESSKCGTATIGHSSWYSSRDTNYAVGILALDNGCRAANGNPLLAHELGHIFGAHHDKDNIETTDDNHPELPYAYGYRCGGMGTVMSYDWPKKLTFSNPNMVHDGEVCGDVQQAYNAKAVNINSEAVANLSRGQPMTNRVNFWNTQPAIWGRGITEVIIPLVRSTPKGPSVLHYQVVQGAEVLHQGEVNFGKQALSSAIRLTEEQLNMDESDKAGGSLSIHLMSDTERLTQNIIVEREANWIGIDGQKSYIDYDSKAIVVSIYSTLQQASEVTLSINTPDLAYIVKEKNIKVYPSSKSTQHRVEMSELTDEDIKLISKWQVTITSDPLNHQADLQRLSERLPLHWEALTPSYGKMTGNEGDANVTKSSSGGGVLFFAPLLLIALAGKTRRSRRRPSLY